MDIDPGLGLVVELDAFRDLVRRSGDRGDVRDLLTDLVDALPVTPYLHADAAQAMGGRGGAVNLVSVVRGRERDWRPLLLAARYDLLNPAALAGVAAALAAARALADARLERDVILALFDDSAPTPDHDRPGAQTWFEMQRRHDLKAAVVLGRLAPTQPAMADGEQLLLVAGVETDARLPAVLDGAAPAGTRLVPTHHQSDGRPFSEHGVPYLRIGCPASGPKAVSLPAEHEGWSDESLALLRPKLRPAAQLAVELLRRLDQARLPGPYRGYDSTEFELTAVSQALGTTLEALGGLPSGREDLDRLADRLAD